MNKIFKRTRAHTTLAVCNCSIPRYDDLDHVMRSLPNLALDP